VGIHGRSSRQEERQKLICWDVDAREG